MKANIFRKVALERLSSPEQLDQLVQVIDPKGWIALMTLLSVLGLTLLWGIFGRIPSSVNGQGILIRTGGVMEIAAISGGQVQDIPVNVGDRVSPGQVVARISQMDLAQELNQARQALSDLTLRSGQFLNYGRKETQGRVEAIKAQEDALAGLIESRQATISNLQERLQVQKQLLADGLITKQTLLATEQDMVAAKEAIDNAHAKSKELAAQMSALKRQQNQEIADFKEKVLQAKRRVSLLEYRHNSSTRVISPYQGLILEIAVDEGDLVNTGFPVMTLELSGREVNDLEVSLFLPAADGKKVKEGMRVHVSPSSVKKEEYGVMHARVVRVAAFPATPERLQNVLHNASLVQQLLSKGSLVEVSADLVPSEKTYSGYSWSSPKGPPVKINSGTLCTASVVTESRRPITLVIPLIKKKLLGVGSDQDVGKSQEKQK